MQGVSEEELERTDNRTQAEELRCVLAVIRHGGEPFAGGGARALPALWSLHASGAGRSVSQRGPRWPLGAAPLPWARRLWGTMRAGEGRRESVAPFDPTPIWCVVTWSPQTARPSRSSSSR